MATVVVAEVGIVLLKLLGAIDNIVITTEHTERYLALVVAETTELFTLQAFIPIAELLGNLLLRKAIGTHREKLVFAKHTAH